MGALSTMFSFFLSWDNWLHCITFSPNEMWFSHIFGDKKVSRSRVDVIQSGDWFPGKRKIQFWKLYWPLLMLMWYQLSISRETPEVKCPAKLSLLKVRIKGAKVWGASLLLVSHLIIMPDFSGKNDAERPCDSAVLLHNGLVTTFTPGWGSGLLKYSTLKKVLKHFEKHSSYRFNYFTFSILYPEASHSLCAARSVLPSSLW